MSNTELTFDGVIFCDDIHQEMTGKYLIIGAYGGTVLLERYPTIIGIACLVQVSPGALGTIPFEFRMTGPHGAVYGVIGGSFDSADSLTQNVLAIPSMAVSITLAGHLNLEYRPPSGEWRFVRRIEALTRAEFTARTSANQNPSN